MNRPLQRTPGTKRGLVAFVLALFALGWLADRAHVAFEVHEYCAEHQRVEHAAAPASSVESGHAGDESAHHEHVRDDLALDGHARTDLACHRSSGPVRGPAIDALEGALGEHAACCILLGRADDSLALPRAFAHASWSPLVEITPFAAAWGTSPRSSIPLLALAPKQSPPAI